MITQWMYFSSRYRYTCMIPNSRHHREDLLELIEALIMTVLMKLQVVLFGCHQKICQQHRGC